MEKKWIINSKEYFPYSAKDIYLNWWITNRKPDTTQSVVEFLHNPVFYMKKLLVAEKQFLKLGKQIKKQSPKDITEYFKNSIETSKIFKGAISRGERIYAIKVPFHIKKWKTQNGKTVWEDIVFSDGTTANLQVIDKSAFNIILSIICTRSLIDERLVDTRFIGSDEIISSKHRDNVYGIKIDEIEKILHDFKLGKDSDSSLFFFLDEEKNIDNVVSHFIKQFNNMAKNGLASLITSEQKSFDYIKGKTIDDKIKNIVQELSDYSHPYFPESIFAVACKNGLGNAVLDVIGIDSGWKKVTHMKKTLDKWLFASLFWTSSNWIKMFFQYSKTPKIYHKLFGGKSLEYRGGDIDWALNYIQEFSNNKKIAVIDFGIGTGRELRILQDNKNIERIIGIDYSEAMLDFCKKQWKDYPIELDFIKDDFAVLENSKRAIKSIRIPKVFTIFFGTINNTTEDDRIRILLAVKKLITKNDIFIVEISKRPEKQTVNFNHPWLKFKNKKEKIGFYEVGVYVQSKWFWEASEKNFGTVPQFFYEKRTHNITVTIPGVGSCFFSHRYSFEEIEGLIKKVGLNIETIREGREMYTAIIKK
jgi:hypothetical protein